MTESKIREEICRLGRSLFERGLTPGSRAISAQNSTTAAGW
jgi:Ribulose-5-phosphate 4-epimerase and related epimerases and aldolases